MTYTRADRRKSGRKGAYAMHRLHPNQSHENGLKSQRLHPDLYSEVMTRTNKQYPNQAREAGKVGGLRTQQLHPNLSSENGRKVHELYPELYSDILKKVNRDWRLRDPKGYSEIKSKAGKIMHITWKERDPVGYRKHQSANGINAALTGQILSAPKGRFSWHKPTQLLSIRHYHRSNDEFEYCIHLQSIYRKDYLHPNVHIGHIEIDWIVSKSRLFDSKDPRTWLKVIEYHQVRSWEGETARDYKKKRISKIRKAGVTCPVGIVFES